MQSFQRALEEFERRDTQVIGISPDDLKTHRKFSEKYGLKFPLVADESKEVRKRYKPGRVTFLVDREGIIRFIQEGMPEIDDFIGEISKLERE